MTSSSAEELKALGNTAFAAKDYDKAIIHYSDAIKLDPSNHVFFSNRSASYGGKGEWDAAVEDAKECIRLDPTFIKGYYRLATAQMELKDWDGATSTIKQGLGVDPNNSQLSKLLRTAKQSKKRDQAIQRTTTTTTTAPVASSTMDASISQELMDLQQQYVQTNREYNLVKNSIAHAQRECKTQAITKDELEKLPLSTNSKMYRGIGKMFLLDSRDNVMEHLEKSIKEQEKRESDLKLKQEYLERRIKSQQQNMEELTKTAL